MKEHPARAVNGPGTAGQGQAGALVCVGDDLGRDGHGCFFRGVGAEIESDRGARASRLVLGYAEFTWRAQPVVVGPPRSAVAPYSDDYDETVARNVREQDADARPAIANPLSPIDR